MAKQPGRPSKEKINCDKVEIDLARGDGRVKIDGKEIDNVVEVQVIGRVCKPARVILNLRPKEILIRMGKGCEVITKDDPKQRADVESIPGGKGDSIATVTKR